MVAITILGIVSAIGLTAYSKAQAIARDGRRKQDIRAIQTALEIYYQKNNHYPCVGSTAETSAAGGNWIVDSAAAGTGCGVSGVDAVMNNAYINQMPLDPQNTTTAWDDTNQNVKEYFYTTPALGGSCPSQQGQYYILKTHLENVNDSESCKNKLYTRCDGLSFCPTGSTETTGQDALFVIMSQ